MTELFNIKRYALVYVSTMVGLTLFGIVLDWVFAFTLPSGLSTILPAMMAAMLEGQKRADSGALRLTPQQAWAAARKMTFIVFVVTAAMFLALVMIPPIGAVLLSLPPTILLGVLAVLMGITLLANRFFVTSGYDAQLKAIAKRDQH